LELDILAFEANGADVRDVVRNDVNLVLVCRQTTDADEQRIVRHSFTFI
jgi:hypothetical protein